MKLANTIKELRGIITAFDAIKDDHNAEVGKAAHFYFQRMAALCGDLIDYYISDESA